MPPGSTRPPLRLLVYDATGLGAPWVQPLLTASWATGASLYRGLGRFDAARGACSWADALDWLATVEPDRALAEVQYWGHGLPGALMLGGERLDEATLRPRAPLHAALAAVRTRARPSTLFWFRTCSTFGTQRGHAFATSWTLFFGCRAAGHTFVIGPLQSGLHSLGPGERPSWPVVEGVNGGAAAISSFGAPNTVTCLADRVPEGW